MLFVAKGAALSDKLTEFENRLYVEGLSDRTIRHYLSRYSYMLSECGEITKKAVSEWIKLARIGKTKTNPGKVWKNSAINAYIKAIKKYGAIFDIKELQSFKRLPEYKRAKPIMNEKNLKRFLQLTYEYPKNWKERHVESFHQHTVFFAVMIFTGRRPIEVANLKAGDVDLSSEVITFTLTKTREVSTKPIHPALVKLLKKYMKQVESDLFPMVNEHTWGKQFKNRVKRLGIDRKGLSVYSLRHSYIQRMVDADGVNIFDVMSLVGHKKIETTLGYYQSSTKRLEKAIVHDPMGADNISYDDVIMHMEKFLASYSKTKSVSISIKKTPKEFKVVLHSLESDSNNSS